MQKGFFLLLYTLRTLTLLSLVDESTTLHSIVADSMFRVFTIFMFRLLPPPGSKLIQLFSCLLHKKLSQLLKKLGVLANVKINENSL